MDEGKTDREEGKTDISFSCNCVNEGRIGMFKENPRFSCCLLDPEHQARGGDMELRES